jgi:hypothetical protein
MWILFEHVKTKNAGWLMNYQCKFFFSPAVVLTESR